MDTVRWKVVYDSNYIEYDIIIKLTHITYYYMYLFGSVVYVGSVKAPKRQLVLKQIYTV